MFDAPIPGMSLTHELGARPWQSPAQYPTVDKAIEYYLERMSTDEFMDQIADVLEMNVPVTTLANTIQLAGVMDGKHTIDVGMLVMPLLMEMIMLIGDNAGVNYDSGLTNAPDNTTKDTLIEAVRKEILAAFKKLDKLNPKKRIEQRREKFIAMGNYQS